MVKHMNWCSLVLILLLASHTVAAVDYDAAWEEYKQTFGKVYKTPAEEEMRKRQFIETKQYIESHNTKSGESFMQGINHLSDLSTEEVNRVYNGFRVNPRQLVENRTITDGLLESLLLSLNSTIALHLRQPINPGRAWYDDLISPIVLDWRASGRVSKVKDQGSCGSCWAFAATGALESLLASRNRSTLLSEQNLIDCSRRYGNNGCSGGMVDSALNYVRDHGLMASRDYRYTASDGQCRFNREKSVVQVRGSARLPRGNEALLRLALSLAGPIPIAIDASLKSFHSYKSGVYNDHRCRSGVNTLNHAVLLVGYGTDTAGRDYWLVKNSWGRKWGDNGYIKMARHHGNLCGLASYAVLPIP